MDLTPEEIRVLACLIEKSHTTPDQYPLSSNALRAACNQKTSREPVVDYSLQLVDSTLQLLRDGGWARSVRSTGDRAFKHKHVIDEKLGLDTPGQAVFAVLALRGAQSAGELRTRTERYVEFATSGDVDSLLDRLADRDPPLVRNIGRGAGQSHDRWVQLVCEEEAEPAEVEAGRAPAPITGDRQLQPNELERRVASLERRLAALEAELGFDSVDPGVPAGEEA